MRKSTYYQTAPYRQAEKYQNSKTLSEVREDPVGIKDEQALKLIFLHQTTLSHAFRDHKELNLHVHELQVALLGLRIWG